MRASATRLMSLIYLEYAPVLCLCLASRFTFLSLLRVCSHIVTLYIMAYEFRNLIWLCWILCSLVSLIEGQFGGSDFRGGGGSFGAPAGFGSGGLSFGNGAGFRGGGSRNGGKSGSDRSGQVS